MAVGGSGIKVGTTINNYFRCICVRLARGVVRQRRESGVQHQLGLTHTTGTFFCSVLVYLWVEAETTTLLESPSVSDLKASPITHSL